MFIDTFNKEKKYRESIQPDKLCKYGVKFLDDALTCILPNDLVVIGAETGSGKTEMSLQIASENAKNGKKVALFFLEGGDIEAMVRMKWRDLCLLYKESNESAFMPISYVEWRTNMYPYPELKTEIEALEGVLLDRYKDIYEENLYIPEIPGGFTLDNLLSELLGFHSLEFHIVNNKPYDLDLIIIDHLQYFDLKDSKNEIHATTQILKECKNITDQAKVPVVLVSHLRKLGKDAGIPGHEDFYGTGNIPKISSTAIVISKDNTQSDYSNDKYFTYFRVVKSRIGLSPNYAAKLVFDGKSRTYDKEYELYVVNNQGFPASDPLNNSKLPRWATRYSQ